MRILGIDPGKTGGIALLDTVTGEEAVYDMPSIDKDIDCLAVVELCKSLGSIDVCTIENVHAMPQQSTQSGFKFGFNCGIARMIPAILGCRVHLVTPMKWKAYYGIKKIPGETPSVVKGKSVMKAKQLFPGLSKLLLKSKDGRAEALLIAEYTKRNLV